MSAKETAKRYILFIIGLFISGIGVAITKAGDLGVSPISSVPNVISIKFDFLSMGNWLIIWNCILIVGQIIILRKEFKWIQLLQVPLSFLFGYFTDFGLWIMSFIPMDNYVIRISEVIVGTIVLGVGISFAVIANVIMNSGEAFVKAISDTIHKDFGNVKIGFDISCVVLSIIISIFLFGGKIEGTREGTIIAAIFTGIVVKISSKIFRKGLTGLVKDKKAK